MDLTQVENMVPAVSVDQVLLTGDGQAQGPGSPFFWIFILQPDPDRMPLQREDIFK